MSVSFLFKRSSTANARPVAANLGEGELNLNINAASPSIYFKDSAGSLIQVSSATASAAAPANPIVGTTWLDTDGPWLNVRGPSTWYRTPEPGTGGDVLSALTGAQQPLHIWSTRQWIQTVTASQKGTVLTHGVTLSNAQFQIHYVPATTSNSIQNSWASTLSVGETWSQNYRMFDQTGNRTLWSQAAYIDTTNGNLTPPLVGSLWGPRSLTDLNTRSWYDTSHLIHAVEQGPAMWMIVQFNMNSANLGTSQVLSGLWAVNNSFTNGSFMIYRTGASTLSIQRVLGSTSVMFDNNVTVPDTTATGKNTILFYDNGTGNVQYSINGGALVDGPVSANSNYIVAARGVGVGGSIYLAANRCWQSPICTMSYWVGTTASAPTAATMQSLAAQMHALI